MSAERGFTLVELLVAMAMSVVVMLGASAIIISSLDVSGQVTGRVTALGEGRTGIETLLAQLNSGCLVNGVSPVMPGTTSGIAPAVSSDASHLVFVSGVGDSGTPTPTEHVVTLRNGALIDSAYKNTGGTPPAQGVASGWTFATTPFQVLTLASNVTAGSNPMFQYDAYQSSSGSLLGASALTPPFTATTAATIAEVDIDIRVSPSGATPGGASATSELQDSAVFSLSAKAATAGVDNLPCT